MVLQKMVQKHQKELPYLGSQMKKPGYLDEVKSLLSEFMQYGICLLYTSFPFLADSLKEKETGEFTDKIEGFLLELEDSLMNFRDVEYRGFVKTEKEIISLFYFKFTDIQICIRDRCKKSCN